MTPDQKQSLNRRYAAAALNVPPKERVQMYLDLTHHPQYNFYDHKLMRSINLLSATDDGKVEYEFTVTPDMCNSNDTLHGGCAATIMDNLTSMIILTIAKPGFLDAGSISRTLTCTYLRPLMAGQKVRVVCEILGAGKTLVHVRGEMLTEDGKVAISCIHDKVPRHMAKL